MKEMMMENTNVKSDAYYETSNAKSAKAPSGGLFGKDFTLVLIGQIISLFGNQVLRYALPLYLLNQTGSAFLFGVTMAASFVPMFLLAPIGGIIADRINKRNIMVALDFSTAGLVLLYSLAYKNLSLVAVTIIMLMLLYGIQGLYQPTVQASVPLLVSRDTLTQGNAMINMVNSLAGILGPVIGGLTFAHFGIGIVLVTAGICFFLSAVMELFITIPYTRQETKGSALSVAKEDLRLGFRFITKDKPEIGKVGILLLVINAVFSALIVVGLPVIISKNLGFDQTLANTLYGYAQGALALGGLTGGILAGVFGKKMDIRKGSKYIVGCMLTMLPIAITLGMELNGYLTYTVIMICCILMMILSTLLSILLVTFVQMVTPEELLGKVMAILSCLVMCGHPVGQLVYGYLLDHFADSAYLIFGAAFLIAGVISAVSHKLFSKLEM